MAAYARAAAAARSLGSAPRCSTSPNGSRPAPWARPTMTRNARRFARVRWRTMPRRSSLGCASGSSTRAPISGIAASSERHRLRIRAKRLRYATEFFAGTFPGEESAKRRTELLVGAQGLAGRARRPQRSRHAPRLDRRRPRRSTPKQRKAQAHAHLAAPTPKRHCCARPSTPSRDLPTPSPSGRPEALSALDRRPAGMGLYARRASSLPDPPSRRVAALKASRMAT